MIRMTVTGINEIVSLLNRNVQDMPTLGKEILDDIADDFVSEMQKNVHVITGNLKSSIYRTPVTSDYVEVGARAEYAVYENANMRPGSKLGFTTFGRRTNAGRHDFATQAFNTVKSRAFNLVVAAYQRLFKGTL